MEERLDVILGETERSVQPFGLFERERASGQLLLGRLEKESELKFQLDNKLTTNLQHLFLLISS